MREFITTIWKDSVGSSVIATLIAALIIWLIAKLFAYLKGISIKEYFSKQVFFSVGTITTFGSFFFVVGILIYSFKDNLVLYKDEIILFGPFAVGTILMVISVYKALKATDRLFNKIAMKIENNETASDISLDKLEEYEKEIAGLKSNIEQLKLNKPLTQEEQWEKDYTSFQNSNLYTAFSDLKRHVRQGDSIDLMDKSTFDYFNAHKIIVRTEAVGNIWKFSEKGDYYFKRYMEDLHMIRTDNELKGISQDEVQRAEAEGEFNKKWAEFKLNSTFKYFEGICKDAQMGLSISNTPEDVLQYYVAKGIIKEFPIFGGAVLTDLGRNFNQKLIVEKIEGPVTVEMGNEQRIPLTNIINNHNQLYAEFEDLKTKSVWKDMDVLRRAKNGHQCGSFSEDSRDYFVAIGLIKVQPANGFDGFYSITPKGHKFYDWYIKEKVC